jgi:hypothetical protein
MRPSATNVGGMSTLTHTRTVVELYICGLKLLTYVVPKTSTLTHTRTLQLPMEHSVGSFSLQATSSAGDAVGKLPNQQ